MHENNPRDRRIDAHLARTQFGQILDRATQNNDRFIVDRRGEPAVVVINVAEFIRRAAPRPDWLEKGLVPFHRDYDGLTGPSGETGWG
jgi:prevent-host-death family protein